MRPPPGVSSLNAQGSRSKSELLRNDAQQRDYEIPLDDFISIGKNGPLGSNWRACE
jgi:hypothetical protein